MKTAIAYFSKKGFIKESAERLRNELGNDTTLIDLRSGKSRIPFDADVIVLACSVYAGHFPGKFRKTCKSWIPRLEGKKIVLLVGGLDDKEYEKTAAKNLSSELVEKLWKIAYSGGRYLPEDYGPVIRGMMKKINQSEGPIHREQWDNLKALAAQIGVAS